MKPYSTPKYFSVLRFLSTTYRSSKAKPKFTFATHWCLPAGRSSLAHCGREWTEFGRKVEENLRHPLHWEATAPNTPGTCYASAQYEELISLWMFPFFLLEDYCAYLLLSRKGMGLSTLEFHCVITSFHQKNGASTNVKLQIPELYCTYDSGSFHYLAGSILKNNT